MGRFLSGRSTPNGLGVISVRPLGDRDSSWKMLVYTRQVSPSDFHTISAEMDFDYQGPKRSYEGFIKTE